MSKIRKILFLFGFIFCVPVNAGTLDNTTVIYLGSVTDSFPLIGYNEKANAIAQAVGLPSVQYLYRYDGRMLAPMRDCYVNNYSGGIINSLVGKLTNGLLSYTKDFYHWLDHPENAPSTFFTNCYLANLRAGNEIAYVQDDPQLSNLIKTAGAQLGTLSDGTKKKVILVGYSEGAHYANIIAQSIQGSDQSDHCAGVVLIAPPGSRVNSPGNWSTLPNDQMVNAERNYFRNLGITVLPASQAGSVITSDAWNHNFIVAYAKTGLVAQTITNVADALNTSCPPPTPPTVTINLHEYNSNGDTSTPWLFQSGPVTISGFDQTLYFNYGSSNENQTITLNYGSHTFSEPNHYWGCGAQYGCSSYQQPSIYYLFTYKTLNGTTRSFTHSADYSFSFTLSP